MSFVAVIPILGIFLTNILTKGIHKYTHTHPHIQIPTHIYTYPHARMVTAPLFLINSAIGNKTGTSLVEQWVRSHLPMWGTQV